MLSNGSRTTRASERGEARAEVVQAELEALGLERVEAARNLFEILGQGPFGNLEFELVRGGALLGERDGNPGLAAGVSWPGQRSSASAPTGRAPSAMYTMG